MNQQEELQSNTNHHWEFNRHCRNKYLCIREPQYKDLEGNKLQIAIVQPNGNNTWEIKGSSNNENQCCVYYDTHDPLQGNWVQCACVCWLHKDCKIQLSLLCILITLFYLFVTFTAADYILLNCNRSHVLESSL